ncbi:transposase [Actinokineospora auranticolor]|uniref:Transposase n=1 Tax=Actinokineospora auranticolor TaxID=155976 RepID=A0A2S6H1A1_9PSEU|nr:transposase [Actinokineospora auranticolor]
MRNSPARKKPPLPFRGSRPGSCGHQARRDQRPQSNPFGKLAEHGPLLVVVDQPATIGVLPVAVTRAAGHQVACLPGLAMRRIADLHPGRAKTDARDAFVTADAARSLPHPLRPVDVGDETLAELEVLVGFGDDLAGEATRITNRIRGLLTGIHPTLEHAIGPRISRPSWRSSRVAAVRPGSPPSTRPAWASGWWRRS